MKKGELPRETVAEFYRWMGKEFLSISENIAKDPRYVAEKTDVLVNYIDGNFKLPSGENYKYGIFILIEESQRPDLRKIMLEGFTNLLKTKGLAQGSRFEEESGDFKVKGVKKYGER